MGMQDLTGQTLGQYELRDRLGVGGMGAVYRAYQPTLKRYVAVKVLTAHVLTHPDSLERFTREIETSGALEHPHIVHIYDSGVQDGISYLVMQQLTGGSLAARLVQRNTDQRPLPSLGEAATLLKQVSSALDYAHSRNVLHRDIKPSNVMFDTHGNAILVDFGIAKLMQDTRTGLTASGLVVGTWGFMAPEQWRGETLVPATDQYALGVMAYQLVTAQLPFDSPTPAGFMHKHLYEAPPPLHNYRSDVPEAVSHVIERALAKVAADRFHSCTALAQAFERAIQGHVGAGTAFFTVPIDRKPPPRTAMLSDPAGSMPAASASVVPTLRTMTRSPLLWLVATVVVILIGLLLLSTLNGGDESDPASGDAVQQAGLATDTLTPPPSPAHLAMFTPTPSPTVNVTATATATDAASPTFTLTPTATSSATATYTPTITLTATPTVDIEYVVQQTIQALDTLTATQWTLTPTPNIEATVAAELTEIFVVGQTATAAVWTNTPTPSDTPLPTATPTITPMPSHTMMPSPTMTFVPSPTFTATPDLTSGEVDYTRVFFPAGANNADWIPVSHTFDGIEMMLVPAGCFQMGTTEPEIDALLAECHTNYDNCERSWYEDEGPAHEVCFTAPFWISRTEVTNAQYGSSGAFSNADNPRENVTWYQARDFCESRGEHLLTEAQWEYAARGPSRWRYPWGNTFVAQYAVWEGNTSSTAPVGRYPDGASWVGALDMSGNVWEWMADWYGGEYYARLPAGVDNPQGPDSGIWRVLRGGGWRNPADFLYTGERDRSLPDNTMSHLGFRCARSFDPSGLSNTPTDPAPDTAADTQELTAAFFPAGSANASWTPVTREMQGTRVAYVPAGCFLMGHASGDVDERPVRRVCVSAYWLAQTEVTNNQYAVCVNAGSCARPQDTTFFDNPAYADHPVAFVSWYDAAGYAAWWGGMLPTETQWEYAARGPEGWIYPWGDHAPTCSAGNMEGCVGMTVPVGSITGSASWVGVYDLAGNVWEWTADYYGRDYYATLTDGAQDPTGPATGEMHNVRGSSWRDSTDYARAFYHGGNYPGYTGDILGFRVALPAS